MCFSPIFDTVRLNAHFREVRKAENIPICLFGAMRLREPYISQLDLNLPKLVITNWGELVKYAVVNVQNRDKRTTIPKKHFYHLWQVPLQRYSSVDDRNFHINCKFELGVPTVCSRYLPSDWCSIKFSKPFLCFKSMKHVIDRSMYHLLQKTFAIEIANNPSVILE